MVSPPSDGGSGLKLDQFFTCNVFLVHVSPPSDGGSGLKLQFIQPAPIVAEFLPLVMGGVD